MIELWLMSMRDSKYTYKFSVLGLKGNVSFDRSLSDIDCLKQMSFSNLNGYYKDDTDEQARIKVVLLRSVKNGNYEEHIFRMTH